MLAGVLVYAPQHETNVSTTKGYPMADKKQQSVAERLVSEATERLTVVTKEIKNVESDVLGPLNKEKEQLEAMLSPKAEASAPEAAPEPSSAPSPQPRVRRSRSGGTHAEKAVKFFGDNPGASASDYAEAAEIAPNYLYRVLGGLVEEGKLKKEGRAYSVA